MGLFRSDRWATARHLLAGLLAYVVAATGLLGAVTRTAHGLDAAGSGLVIICTIDGIGIAHDDGGPAKTLHPPQHCVLCNVGGGTAAPADTDPGADVVPPAAPRAPGRSYGPVLPAHDLAGWLGTRPPRAPPFAA